MGCRRRPASTAMLARLARQRDVAILSNWPLAATIDRYAEARGWLPHLRAIVVSQRVGTIKPHPAIFAAARSALGDPAPAAILHVGDDWAADVVGAAGAGWRTAWVTSRPDESPLPSSERSGTIEPDLELASVGEVERHLERGRALARGNGSMRRAGRATAPPCDRAFAPLAVDPRGARMHRSPGSADDPSRARRTRSPMGRGQTTTRGSRPEPGDKGGTGLVVLVVDDEPVIRAYVARALTLAGMDVAVAAAGAEALRLVADGRVRPAVVVTDIEMPGMSGVELAARLLAMRPNLRIVMMTGDPDRAEAARGHPSIVDEVLLKPIRPADLVEAVRPAAGRAPVA